MQEFAVNWACLWTLGSHWGRAWPRCAPRICWGRGPGCSWRSWDARPCTHTASSSRPQELTAWCRRSASLLWPPALSVLWPEGPCRENPWGAGRAPFSWRSAAAAGTCRRPPRPLAPLQHEGRACPDFQRLLWLQAQVPGPATWSSPRCADGEPRARSVTDSFTQALDSLSR